MPPTAANIAAQKIKLGKKRVRKAKAASVKRSKVRALPAIPKVILDQNYVNPITLEFPKGLVIYEITNRMTGRKNYYNKETFRKLITRFKNDYNLLMANPKSPIPGAKNPVTRGKIFPRNVRRVTVKAKAKSPSKSAAARKIQSAVRKHLKKKKAVKK
jgi:hypothetical protein